MIYKKIPLEEFMAIYHKVTRAAVDVVINTKDGILLTKRAMSPFKGMWHIPGGSVLFREPILHAINRIAQDELGIEVKIIKLLGVIECFEDDGRHTISNAYLTEISEGKPRGSEQGKEIAYFKKLPENCIPFQKKFLEDCCLPSLSGNKF